MTRAYLWQVSELITRYKLEPSLRDLYVEGPSDRDFFRWFADELNLVDMQAYPIESVDIPDAAYDAVIATGNKGRVVALSVLFDESLDPQTKPVLCVADRDLDAFLGRLVKNRFLAYTDFTSSEMYAAQTGSVQKVIRLFMRLDFSQDVYEDLCSVCTRGFLIRAVCVQLSIVVPWIDLTNCCRLRNGRVVFDEPGFVKRLLTPGGATSRMDEFVEHLTLMQDQVDSDCRNNMHGHDFVEVLRWYGSRRGAGAICSSTSISRALFTSIDCHQLATLPLFDKIRTWASN